MKEQIENPRQQQREEEKAHMSLVVAAMAEHLPLIFETGKVTVKWPFYFQTGASRHNDRCSFLHTKPSISLVILLPNMYQCSNMITPRVDANIGMATSRARIVPTRYPTR